MTITNDALGSVYGEMQDIPNYIVVTSLDSTASTNGPWIDNRDGRVKRISFVQLATNTGGTTNTLQTTLKGSLDGGTTAYNITDSAGNAIQTTSQDTSSANGSSTSVNEAEDTNAEGISNFPPLFRLNVVQGGTSATLTGRVSIMVQRRDPNVDD